MVGRKDKTVAKINPRGIRIHSRDVLPWHTRGREIARGGKIIAKNDVACIFADDNHGVSRRGSEKDAR